MTEKIGNKLFNYLIGFESSELNNQKLPIYRDVINLFMHDHRCLKFTIRQNSTEVIKEVINIWNNFSIPTSRIQHIIEKFEKFYDQYKKIKIAHKNKNKAPVQQQITQSFTEQLDQLFDIANCEEIIHLPEYLQVYLMKCREKGSNNKLVPIEYTSFEQSLDIDNQLNVTGEENDTTGEISELLKFINKY